MSSPLKNLLETNDFILCGEGYLFELERRGYVKVGPFVPMVVLEHPDAVKQLHREFCRAGSNIVEAFTYYGHRDKLKLINQEDKLELLNRKAIQLAKEVSQEFPGTLVAGNVCNSTTWDPTDLESQQKVKENLQEQVQWAKEEGVDFIIGETFGFLEEALLACRVIKEAGLDAVITISINGSGKMGEGQTPLEACQTLEAAGVDVVGFNCTRGPQTMYTVLEEVAKSGKISVPLAALPVMYRTNEDKPTMQSLTDPKLCYMDLELHLCTRMEAFNFAQIASQLPNVKYFGVCCGGSPYHLRAMANALKIDCQAADCNPDLSKHFALNHGNDSQKEQFFQ